MERLTARDLRRVLDFVADLHTVDDLDAFPRHVLAALPRVVPSNQIVWTEVNNRRHRPPRAQWLVRPEESDFPGGRELFARHLHEHPIYQHFVRTGDGSATTISDFLTQPQLHDLGLYHLEYLMSVEYVAKSALVARVPSLIIGLALCRGRRDFSERDRRLMDLLRPHLIQAYRNAEAATIAREEHGLTCDGLEASGIGAIQLDARGRVLEVSGLARRWVERYFGPLRDGHLPQILADWVRLQRGPRNGELPPPPRPLVAQRDGARLVARLLTRPRASLILLQKERIMADREALAHFGLSRREAEVLTWVAEGKTNPEIATILGLSPRTVGNHLARIYAQLGVETRTAAARIALTAP